ncbi:hypothetical protein KP509_16G016300 [Ceratopteris richardii]|uniref:Pentatricopeptide repeat-containing protein n=1 Tax=Ceratopteris richardii TaxID=49495 RepID=A0A8T2SYE8_CERRI|nr:hypothetical protein KP509_16G016300 [Ceratopteris richardii]
MIRDEGMLPQPSCDGFVVILNKCRREGSVVCASILYLYMQRNGLVHQQLLGNQLVSVLAQLGLIDDALQAYGNLSHPMPSTWRSIIRSCVQWGLPDLALTLYENAQKTETSYFTGRTFISLIKACAKTKNVQIGCLLHDHVFHTHMLIRNPFVGSSLVDMYCKCGLLSKAKQVFDGLPVKDVVTWTAMIDGYAENGHSEEAVICLAEMQQAGIYPNSATFICVLKACIIAGDLSNGQDIHGEIERRGLLESDVLIGNALVDFYVRFGLLTMATQVFQKLQVHDLVTWTALISGYSESGNGEKALYCFEEMQLEGIHPDPLTYASVIKACGILSDIQRGRELHVELKKKGLPQRDVFIGTALVDMYAKCGLPAEAHQVFDMIYVRDTILWNSLISGFADNGFSTEAIKCYEQMQLECILPNSVSFACTLKACANLSAALKGKEIHAKIVRKGLPEKDATVVTALVDMYARVGLLPVAQEVFDNLCVRDVATWNSLITGYAEQDLGEEAFKYFEKMQLEGVSPNNITYVCVLKACGILGAADKGQELHTEIESRGFFNKDIVGNALVYMYAKCGWLMKAQQVFNNLVVQDAVAWTALMAGYAKLGEIDNVFEVFDRMLQNGVKPSLVTFIIILNACSLTGFPEKSETFFNTMIKVFGIAPAPHHYTCLIDLHSRVGQLDEALSKIKEMPSAPNLVTWHAVIEGCKYLGDVDFADKAFKLVFGSKETNTGAYIVQPHIHADNALLDEANTDEYLEVNEA